MSKGDNFFLFYFVMMDHVSLCGFTVDINFILIVVIVNNLSLLSILLLFLKNVNINHVIVCEPLVNVNIILIVVICITLLHVGL